ncbi:MAG: hypothetical protein H7A15_01970 [Sinobacteraceae bacterium]|nr:hypothetical protein [Nevskiaceae bacterium]
MRCIRCVVSSSNAQQQGFGREHAGQQHALTFAAGQFLQPAILPLSASVKAIACSTALRSAAPGVPSEAGGRAAQLDGHRAR